MAKKSTKKKKPQANRKRKAPGKKKGAAARKPAKKSSKSSTKKPQKKRASAKGKTKKKTAVRRTPARGGKSGQVSKKKQAAKKKQASKKKSATKRKAASKKTAKKAPAKKSSRTKKKTAQTKKATPKKKPSSRRRRSTAKSRSRSRSTKNFIKIKVVGVGGGGGNAITRMRKNFSVRGVEFVAINTDVQDLELCDAHKKLHIGKTVTKGMGAGMNPDLGMQAAEENRAEIADALQGADMVFLTSGFGGGTGTGAAPIIAEVSRELGILTVAVVTKPFSFEGTNRAKIADDGLVRIKDKVDTLLVIPNDRIFTVIDKNTSVLKAFEKIDDILRSAVQGVAEIISSSGLVNVDFADIRAVTAGAGMAVIGVGTAKGAERATKAINQAMNSPLLDISIDGARSVLFGVAGGRDMKMSEINEAAKIITDSIDPGARIIFGAYYDRKLKAGSLKITLIATGFSGMMFKKESGSLTLFEDEDETFTESPGLEEDSSKEGDSRGIFSESPAKDEEELEEILDTPAFLRKKKRRK